MPALRPVTTPVVSTVAIEVAVLLQTPPVVALDNVMVLPAQTDATPGVITAGAVGVVITEIEVVAALVPQILEAV